jgi:sterol desaturase/sphingolipid hydroxylase (fatty acid hydroxylase superfamily)
MRQIKVRIYPQTKSPRIFDNKVLELLTRTHPLVITAMYITLGIFLIWTFASFHPEIPYWYTLLIAVGGFFSWTFAEYMMHRFFYHKSSDASFNTGFHYLFHGIHHEYPDDHERLVLPPIPSIIIASLFLGLFYLLMNDWAFVFGTGFLWGYLSYMNVHYIIHRFGTPSNKHLAFWWRHHAIHHFQQHDRAFGVTTALWDHVFGTMPEKQRRTVEIERMKHSHGHGQLQHQHHHDHDGHKH